MATMLGGNKIVGMAKLSISLAGGHLPTIEKLLEHLRIQKSRFLGIQILKFGGSED